MEPAIKLQPGTNSRGSELEQRVTKGDIRQKIWDYMEKNNLANFPRPVHHRIPNFKGAYDACNKIRNLDCYIKAREVKVDPDKPLEGVRLAALQARKTLLVPTPRLRKGLFNKIVPPPGAAKEIIRVCSTAQGVKDFSVPVQLDAKVHIDLVVVGSVAVSKNGWRIGKGEGFADLEYAMMVSMGSIDEKTVVVTTVHDCQLLDIPEELMDNHDLIVDYILTPTQVITTDCKRSKPQGIIWSKTAELAATSGEGGSSGDCKRPPGPDSRTDCHFSAFCRAGRSSLAVGERALRLNTCHLPLAGFAHVSRFPQILKFRQPSNLNWSLECAHLWFKEI
ncbi:methenyltetrahydrofolate synthase domain-containing protein isoform X13 [Leucoraja erinacea]|uniref:methenyltetrahydrofolate synthase domain-containing protein isoform X13 n=1 Tax=Leucoraja erinaceus TaxID=7782 RepID=UPI0024553994|nr:methenyltetrahydrofolate synthase domain-containing protein isoform X13 [Leucoraja erinacea]